jgi:hypothetical protein
MKTFWIAGFLVILSTSVFAQEKVFFNDRVARAFVAVKAYNQTQGVLLSQTRSKFELEDNFVAFTDEMPLDKPVDSWRDPDKSQQTFEVRTIFLRQSPTIEKRVHVRQGPEEMARMRFIYRPAGKKETIPQFTYRDDVQAWQIYEGRKDVFFYTQEVSAEEEVQLKEWIYAETANHAKGSLYEWDVVGEEFNRFIELDEDKDGTVAIRRHVMVGGVDPKDKKENKRVVGVVREAMKDIPIYIHGEDVVGRIQPVKYWTNEGIEKTGLLKIKNEKRLIVMVREPASAYPLVIDPCVVISER